MSDLSSEFLREVVSRMMVIGTYFVKYVSSVIIIERTVNEVLSISKVHSIRP